MPKNKGHSDEQKQDNQKTVTVDGEEKLLLMDDEEEISDTNVVSEDELYEFIKRQVEAALQEF